MFYCTSCAEKNGWPLSTLHVSYGRCEICRETDICNDVPSRLLPPVKEDDE